MTKTNINMFEKIINPAAILIALVTTAGVIIHDTQVDRATTMALTLPSLLASYAVVDLAVKSSDPHTHVERISGPKHHHLRATVPRVVPRDDDKRHIATKKVGLAHDDLALWPSV